MSKKRAIVWWLLVGVTALGCGGGGGAGGNGDAGDAADDAADDAMPEPTALENLNDVLRHYLELRCERANKCGTQFQSTEDCVAGYLESAEVAVARDSVTAGTMVVDKNLGFECYDALMALSCAYGTFPLSDSLRTAGHPCKEWLKGVVAPGGACLAGPLGTRSNCIDGLCIQGESSCGGTCVSFAAGDPCAFGSECEAPDAQCNGDAICELRPQLNEDCVSQDDDPCVPGLTCDEQMHKCVNPAAVTESCLHRACAEPLVCIANVCAPPLGEGETCGEGAPCDFGLRCISSKCEPVVSLGGQCTKNEECTTQNCKGGVCGFAGIGESCETNLCEPGLLCTSNEATPRCYAMPTKAGDVCDSGYVDEFGLCPEGLYCDSDSETDPKHHCKERKANGTPCSSRDECLSTLCFGQCFAPLPNGTACPQDGTYCASGRCLQMGDQWKCAAKLADGESCSTDEDCVNACVYDANCAQPCETGTCNSACYAQ